MALPDGASPDLATGVASVLESASKSTKKLLLLGILSWQKTLGPLLGPRCRFYPSCSQYAKETLLLYPLPKAFVKSTKRILKCHPFHPGGIDLP